MKRVGLLAVMGFLASLNVTASDAERDAHMIERAEAWFEKFQAATPEQQARMLERRNACLQVPEAQRREVCGGGQGHGKGQGRSTETHTAES